MRQFVIVILTISVLVGCSSQKEIIKARLVTQETENTQINITGYLHTATEFYMQKSIDSALVYCHKSYAENPTNWELYFLYGQISMQTKKYMEADNYFNRALEYSKKEIDARSQIYFALGENEDARKNYKKAAQHYLMVVQLNPNSSLAQTAAQKIRLISSIQ